MSGWTEEREDDTAVAAEYVLGLLEPAELAAFESRLEIDPDFRALVALWTEDLAALALAIPETVPPARIEAALMRRLFPEQAQPFWRRLGILPAILGGLAAALIVLWTTNAGLIGPQPEGPAYAATVAAEDGSLVVAARFDPASGLLEVDRTAGAAPRGRVLELWLIADGAQPVSLGVLPDGAEARIEVPEGQRGAFVNAVLAITDEPPGGAPGGIPSGTILASGAVTTL